MQIDTIRPDSLQSASGWTATPSGTLYGVTSDNSDSTYALWSGTGSAMLLGLADHALPTDHQRHLARVRVRGQSADVNWSIRLTNGTLIAPGTAAFSSSASTVIGSWGTGVPAVGAADLAVQVQAQANSSRVIELYVDIDSRLAPTFTPQVLDDGTPTTTVVDTNAPQVRANSVDLDGLPPRQYRYWVTQGVTTVWDTGVVSGPAVTRTVAPLANGSYELHAQVWSTLGASTAYASVVEDLAFTVSTTVTQPPASVTIDEVPGTPYFDITTCAPASMDDWDGDEAYVEIQRIDCDGNVTRIALAGPIGADECVTYRDWTVPRSLPAGCVDELAECSVTWRARFLGLINGLITASDWFGEPLSPIVPGVIVAWPGAVADIPTGWSRDTSLDGRYLKGGASPGLTGGAASHSHTTPGHVHSQNHNHTGNGATGTAVGSYNAYVQAFDPGGNPAPGNFWTTTSHTHTRPNAQSVSVNSQSTSPETDTENNDPDRLDVVWIKSDSRLTGLPSLSLALTLDIAVTGWSGYSDATDRFLKGAVTGADGGTTSASTLTSHTHTVDSHTHGGTFHTHTSNSTGSVAATLPGWAGANAAGFADEHDHSVTVTSASTGTTGASTATSGSASPSLPPYRNLRVQQNTSGQNSIQSGLIAAYLSSSPPTGWLVCDGSNGTPDMEGYYPRGATTSINSTGGDTSTHTHTGGSHTHTISSHSHAAMIGTATYEPLDMNLFGPPTTTVARHDHTHTTSNTSNATPSVGSASTGTLAAVGTEPPFTQVTFIQFDELPAVTGTADVQRTLYWTDGEHLVRTNTPDGPVYVSACGELSWSVDRPFTVNQGVMGGRQVYSSPPGGHNVNLTLTVRTESALHEALRVFDSPLVLVSPADSTPVWASPVGTSIRVIKVGRIRQLVVPMIATGPEPQPEVT